MAIGVIMYFRIFLTKMLLLRLHMHACVRVNWELVLIRIHTPVLPRVQEDDFLNFTEQVVKYVCRVTSINLRKMDSGIAT